MNPEHLFLGNPAVNAADRNAKRRQASGSRNGRAKLSEGDVVAIRACHARGERLADLAREYGLEASTIRDICARRIWKAVA